MMTSKPIRRLRTLLAITTFSLSLGVGAWAARAPILETIADWWIVSDEPLSSADAVVVLGGGIDVRPFAAARLVRAQLTNKVLVSDPNGGPAVSIGATPSHAEINRQVLVRLGVASESIELFGHGAVNTMEEAKALLEWANFNHAKSIIIPIDLFSARRVRWTFRQVFYRSEVHLQINSVAAVGYTSSDWWRNEQGLIAFQNEILKYIYYRVKYLHISTDSSQQWSVPNLQDDDAAVRQINI